MQRSSCLLLLLLLCNLAIAEPVVYPYLQNVQVDSAELYWVDTDPRPVEVTWPGYKTHSKARPAPELLYQDQEIRERPDLGTTPARYLHKARLAGLLSATETPYKVHYSGATFEASFRTLPNKDESVRLIVYADSETEPESTGNPAKWGTPSQPDRRYLVDQSLGYQKNLETILKRAPEAILIAGDLVESGGEQRDWDEFWNQNKRVACRIPLLPSPGNHEYWAGPKHGGYSKTGSRWAIAKYRTYFHPRGKDKASHYYSQEIGRVTLISLDSGDGAPHKSQGDSNHFLEAAGELAPGFHPGSSQTRWLEAELKVAQEKRQFTVVMFHHSPYSSGVHGFEPGTGAGKDEQSGQALRGLTPLFHRYGVDVVLSGHDEMMERSVVEGVEELPDGTSRSHTLHFYDVGIAGDGLRGPKRENEYGRFLAYSDSPEVWSEGRLQSGGRHYGHLEIEVVPASDGGWKASLTPVYILPLKTNEGWDFQRRVYPDVLTLTSAGAQP